MDVLKALATMWVVLTLCSADSMMDRVYGEALLNSVNPGLKKKLEDIHEEGVLDGKSSKEMTKIVKSRLTEDEIIELEAAYKKIIIPMLEATLESQFGKKVNLDDVDLTEDSSEDSSEEDTTDEDIELDEMAGKVRIKSQAEDLATDIKEKNKLKKNSSTFLGNKEEL